MCLSGRLLWRHRYRQSPGGDPDDQNARRRMRHREHFHQFTCRLSMTFTSPYILEAVNISKRFGELQALSNVTLKLRAGSFHALLGENGAGKSTLVKCIMGYYHPDEGKILVDHQQVTVRSPRDAQALGIG